MIIKMKCDPGMEWETIEVTSGSLLADIAAKAEEEGKAPYRLLIARVNGRDTELTASAAEGSEVEFLDMRNHVANMVYQRGLSMIYLAAIKDVFEAKGLAEPNTIIENSLNKGFFTKIECEEEITEELVAEISARMQQLVEEDVPIEKELVSVEEAMAIWNEMGYPEKAELMEEVRGLEYPAVFYSMNGYRNYFFGPMPPSAGYIRHFELLKYRKGLLLRFPYYNKPDVIPEFVDQIKLYEAFEEEYEWLDIIGADTVPEMNRLIEEGKSKDVILLSEALHEKKIANIASEIKEKGKRIILIAGPSSSGKTSFAKRLCIQLHVTGLSPLYLGTDDYFVERDETPVDEKGEKDFENIGALDIDLFSKQMNALLAGEEVDIPEFNFVEGRKMFGKRVTKIRPDQPIVIEGIHALNDMLTEQIEDSEKYRIYISPLTQINIDAHNRLPSTDARMLRRMVRDYKYRNHMPSDTIRDWPKVRAGEDRNIFPHNGRADVVFNSTLAYETFLLRKYAEPLLAEIGPDQPEFSEARRLLEIIRFFRIIEEEKYVPNNSIIREFIGGSVLVE